MSRPLLLRGARQLLTLRGVEAPRRGADCLDLGIINDGSVLIRDGRIISVGPSRRIDNLAEARHADVVDVHGAVVMPGFVDAGAALPPSAALQLRFLQLAGLHGSTTIGAHARYDTLRPLRAGARHPVALIRGLELDPEFDSVQISRASARGLARYLRLDLASYSRDALRFFHTLSFSIRAHAHTKASPDWLGLAVAYGACAVEIDVPLNPAQLALLSDSPVCAIVSPSTPGAARELLRAGAAVAIASGFVPGSASTCSMQTATLLACLHGGIDLAEAITLSTINAAFALGEGARRGSLEAGKIADILVLRIADIADLPHFFGVNVVAKIFQAGKLVI